MHRSTALLLLATSACVVSPTNGELTAAGQSIVVDGYYTEGSRLLKILASPTLTGTYEEVAEVTSNREPAATQGGVSAYAYSKSVVIPSELWTGDACRGKETFIKVRAPDGSFLPTVAPDGSPGDPSTRIEVPASGTPFVHVGDVVITNAADQASWVCLGRLYGDLQVADSSLPLVELPVLERVTGDVEFIYTRLPNENGGRRVEARHIEAPALATIGGSVTLDSPAVESSRTLSIDFGLEALTQLGGDLTLHIDPDTFNVGTRGLNALTHVPGHLTVSTDTDDSSLGATLSALASVSGDVWVDLGRSTALDVLPALVSVGGSFAHVEGDIHTGAASYAHLATVGGDFTVAHSELRGPDAAFPRLRSVGQTFRYENVGQKFSGPYSIHLGAPKLTVGALTVIGNPVLTAMGAPNLQVVGPGGIEVTGNSSLCTSTVDAFVAGQVRWTGGPATIAGNAGC